MAKLEKLTITSCEIDAEGNYKVGSDSFSVMINPAGYSHDRKITYSREKRLGGLTEEHKFASVDAETISFNEIVIDGTGAVPRSAPGAAPSPDVKTQIKKLADVVYNYVGRYHEPPGVRLAWGDLMFFGRLQTMSVNYTLFKPNGEPLRAKVKLVVVGTMSAQEEARRANRSSPDLSHRVEVKAGDTLPLLCYQIYRDSSYYTDVAGYNNLSNFRDLKPGTQLFFPPLV